MIAYPLLATGLKKKKKQLVEVVPQPVLWMRKLRLRELKSHSQELAESD